MRKWRSDDQPNPTATKRYPLQRIVHLEFWPSELETVASAWIEHGAGPDRARRRLWTRRLPVVIADLRGRTGGDVAWCLCRLLLDTTAFPDSDTYRQAVGPGAPDGATGRAWTEPPLPGLEPTLVASAGELPKPSTFT